MHRFSRACRPADERRILDGLTQALDLPAGWRTLTTDGRVEARWSGQDGAAIRFTASASADPPAPRPALVHSVVKIGPCWLSLLVDSTDLELPTMHALQDLLVALARVVPARDA